jgi:hypothetical protein
MPHVTASSGAACCAEAAWVLGSGRPRFSRRWPLRRRRKGHGPPRQTRHGRRRGGMVTALRMEVRRLDVEADVPASAVPTTGREQDPGPRRHHKLPGASIVLRDGTEQPPQSTGVVMYTNRADLRQGHRAGMTFPDPDQPGAAAARLIAEPEALAATTFALVPREADPPSLAASLRFQASKALIRSNPDHGTTIVGSLVLCWNASVTNRRHWLYAKREAPA